MNFNSDKKPNMTNQRLSGVRTEGGIFGSSSPTHPLTERSRQGRILRYLISTKKKKRR